MRRTRWFTVAAVVATSCSGGQDASDAEPEVRVPETSDGTSTLPDGAVDVELGELGPGDDLTFCQAFAATRTDWVDGAVVPLRWWIEAYSGVDDEPGRASKALVVLRDFARRKVDWNLGRIDERPIYDRTIARHAVAIADGAVAACPDLPLVTGLNSTGAAPATWIDESAEDVTARCEEQIERVEHGVAAYVERMGRQPGHQEQVAAEAYLSWAFEGEGELFISSDYVGIDITGTGTAVAAPVPGGVCDR